MTREKAHAALVAMLRDVLPDVAARGEASPVRREYAGHHQRSAGAWSWSVRIGVHDIGSQWPLAEVLKAHREGRISIYEDRFDLQLSVENQSPPPEKRHVVRD